MPNVQRDIKTDDELILLYQKSGDNQWLGLLLERHTLLLLGVAMKYLKDRENAQDAVQQVFIRAITHFPNEPIQNFKGWLYILMRNFCLSYLKAQQFLLGDEQLEFVAAPEMRSTQDWMQEEALHEKIQLAIAQLVEEQQICIRMFYLQQRSYKEIMEQTQFSFEQVKSFIQNGKRNLKIIVGKMVHKNEL